MNNLRKILSVNYANTYQLTQWWHRLNHYNRLIKAMDELLPYCIKQEHHTTSTGVAMIGEKVKETIAIFEDYMKTGRKVPKVWLFFKASS
ncbi:unnamed protein product [Caenorhabditis bovis]|uniref:Uncharacterized protein n=1 Tax=Caenorhabditis bovis TaxID=2654633 RepID=A0A8S1EJN2_9PELO|nr:unnamed protein product [Caenorhabditis bovis]